MSVPDKCLFTHACSPAVFRVVFTALLFCAMLYKMEAKSSAQMGRIRRFFIRCLPIPFTPHRESVHVSEREIFSTNYSKFALE